MNLYLSTFSFPSKKVLRQENVSLCNGEKLPCSFGETANVLEKGKDGREDKKKLITEIHVKRVGDKRGLLGCVCFP